MSTLTPRSPRVDPVQRIVAAVGVQIHPVDVSGRVGLHKPPRVRAVIPHAVVVQFCGAVPPPAGKQIRIAVQQRMAGGIHGRIFRQPVAVSAACPHHPRPAIGIIRIAFFDIAGAVAQQPNRPQRIGIVIKPVPVTADVLNRHHRIIYSRPIDVFTYQRAAAALPFSESRIESSSDPEIQHPSKVGRLLSKLLICSLLFFDVFPKQPFRSYYTPPISAGKPFPQFFAYFLHNFLLHPQNPTPSLSNPAAPGGGR